MPLTGAPETLLISNGTIGSIFFNITSHNLARFRQLGIIEKFDIIQALNRQILVVDIDNFRDLNEYIIKT